MKRYRDELETNRRSWDQWTAVHVRSRFYDVPAFEAGRSSLTPLETEAAGDVGGKSLLHLQCHFGLDTLSWARLGARATGLDFSEVAIAEAKALARRVGEEERARFVCASVYEAPLALLGETFDVVFTSYGVLSWLPELAPWAEVVARCLRPGGRFHLVEFHPVIAMFDEAVERIAYPYDGPSPIVVNEQGTYADRSAPLVTRTYNWNHGLGSVVSALLRAGLTIETMREHDFSPYDIYPDMVKAEPGVFRLRKLDGMIPLLYSLSAVL